MATKKKKSRKMDRKLFAAKQPHEVRTVINKYKKEIPKEVILAIAKEVGRSRVDLYKALLDWYIKKSKI